MSWLRRKADEETEVSTEAARDEHQDVAGDPAGPVQLRGPRDVSEAPEMFTDGEPVEGVVDLGSLLIQLREGLDLRLQVDETSGEVLAALIVGEDGMLELRAFSAARNEGLWADVRKEIAADTAQRGGTAGDREGAFGTELYCEVPVEMEDGNSGVQPSRILGWNGPRWFLRGALLGRPAMAPEETPMWEELFAAVVVRRGEGAMPPGEPLPIQLPAEARRIE